MGKAERTVLAAIVVFLALTLPTGANACVTQAYRNAVCKAPNQATSLCRTAKAQPLCTGGQGGGSGGSGGNPSLGGACIVGSCVAPKGKTQNEWRTMSETARQEYISRMPATDLRDFNTRVEARGRAPG